MKILLISLLNFALVVFGENLVKQDEFVVSDPVASVGEPKQSECEHRDYGNGGTVCVCSSSQCDHFTPLDRPPLGMATVYTTTKAGDRFVNKRVKFDEDKAPGSTIDFFVKRAIKYQNILGFGGAFTDAAGINIARLPAQLQDRLIRDYFGNNGLQYTMGRVPIGGSDFSTRPYTYDDIDEQEDETLSKFALQEEDLNYKIPFLKRAVEVSGGKVRLFASPWSAPAWMKTNGEINHGGFIKGKPGGKYYKIYTKYLIKFLKEYAKHGLNMWGMTVQNEPSSGYNGEHAWNSLGFNGTLERDFIKIDLGPELHSKGFDKLKLMIYDGKLGDLKEFTDTVLADEEAAKYVSGVAFHWYNMPTAGRVDLDAIRKQYPDKFVLATEACEEWKGKDQHVWLGNWQTFNRYAEAIIKDLLHSTSGWVDWNLALDLNGGPNWAGNFVDAPIIINATGNEYYKQPMYYALAHFTRFLPPGSVRIFNRSATNGFLTANNAEDGAVESVAFKRPDNGIVLIFLNKSPTSARNLYISDVTNGYLNLTVPAESLVSVLWYDD